MWIVGAGHHFSPMFKDQQITVIARGNSKIRGVTIQNNGEQGTGLWLENSYPEIKENFFYQNSREGIFVAGDSNPLIEDNVFEEQSSSGIFFVTRAQGIVINNFFQGNRRAIAITGQASPQITSNHIINNEIGLILSRDCAPRLRQNLIKNSTDTGLVITGAAQPDLGYEEEPGQNIFENNHQYDLHNKTSEEIIFVGNGINPDKIAGPVEIIPIDGPDLFEVEMTDEAFGNLEEDEEYEADFDLMTFTQDNLAKVWEEAEDPAAIELGDEIIEELGLSDREDDLESEEFDVEGSALSDGEETDSLGIEELSLIEELGSMMDDDEDFMDFDQGIMAELIICSITMKRRLLPIQGMGA
ncbi:MAG: DUF1565 domain-containing protein [Synechococcaceae cyanobacterium RL_1_2]|nr:DUF1565 domain-containing protein [Synechococcaceae cyanobacterium RL_1_2]